MIRQMAGYTILEAMIFMAVSGLLFATVVISFMSRQDRTSFTQSVRYLENKINDVVNDVSTGYFPSSSVSCSVNGGGTIALTDTGGVQGTNKDCIFLGKALNFQSSGNTSTTMSMITLVGKREATNLAQANVTAVVTQDQSEVEKYTVKSRATVTKVIDDNGANVGAAPIFMLNYSDTSSNTKQVSAGVVPGSNLNATNSQLAGIINSANLQSSPDRKIIICLSDDKTGDIAAISVGGQSLQAVASFNKSGDSQKCAS